MLLDPVLGLFYLPEIEPRKYEDSLSPKQGMQRGRETVNQQVFMQDELD